MKMGTFKNIPTINPYSVWRVVPILEIVQTKQRSQRLLLFAKNKHVGLV